MVAFVSAGMGQFRCGILALFGFIALAYDFGIRRRANEAKANERSKGEALADVFR